MATTARCALSGRLLACPCALLCLTVPAGAAGTQCTQSTTSMALNFSGSELKYIGAEATKYAACCCTPPHTAPDDHHAADCFFNLCTHVYMHTAVMAESAYHASGGQCFLPQPCCGPLQVDRTLAELAPGRSQSIPHRHSTYIAQKGCSIGESCSMHVEMLSRSLYAGTRRGRHTCLASASCSVCSAAVSLFWAKILLYCRSSWKSCWGLATATAPAAAALPDAACWLMERARFGMITVAAAWRMHQGGIIRLVLARSECIMQCRCHNCYHCWLKCRIEPVL